MSDLDSTSQGLHCSCGFGTSIASYMLLHLSEGSCIPSDAQAAMIRRRLSEIHIARMGLQDTLAKLDDETRSLDSILRLLQYPIIRDRKDRLCRVCGKPTKDRFGASPQCLRHIKATSVEDAIRATVILEQLMSDDDYD
jgi:hypothetical protein